MGIEKTELVENDLSEPVLVPTAVPWPTFLTGALRFKFFLTGFVFPVICLVIVACLQRGSAPRSPWQSGRTIDYVIVLIQSPAILWFYPILAYSFVTIALWCWRPLHYSRFTFVRVGLQTGIILAATFVTLLFITTSFIGPIMAAVVMATLALVIWLINRFVKKLIRFSILNLMVFTTIVAVVLALLASSGNLDRNGPTSSIGGFLLATLMFVCGGAPTMGLVTFIRTSVSSRYLSGMRPIRGKGLVVGWIAWLSALGASWKFAIETMMVEYSKLPTQNPNCYISSAAASGHRWLVSATQVPNHGVVNLQMKRCKFFEFALMACYPAAAHALRRIYNCMGPVVAKFCRKNRWFADVTYLVLKPVEWTALVVQHSLNIHQQRIDDIYTRSKDDCR